MATQLVRKAQDERGLARVSPGFLRRSAGATFQGIRWVLRPATGAVGSAGGVTGGRPAAQDPQHDSRHVEQVLRGIRRAKGLRLRAYDRFASDLRRLPGRPDEGGLSAMFLIGRDCALAPVAPRPRPWTWPLASPAWRAGRHRATKKAAPGK